VMGAWPPLVEKPRINYNSKEHVENFTRHKIEVEVSQGRVVGPQYLLVPDGAGPSAFLAQLRKIGMAVSGAQPADKRPNRIPRPRDKSA